MKKVLSISVAAYNLEKLITKNLDSFVNAKNKEKIEVIVTDDESKDNTAKIVSEYEKKYPGIVRLVKQKNAGPGSTVNSGIKHATGKYFKMVDGDDWVITENLDKIVEILEKTNVDMVLTNHQTFSAATNSVIECSHLDVPANQELVFNDYSKDMMFVMHNTMFKTDILQKNKIKLDNCFYTDTEYLLFPIKYVNTFMYIDLDFYVYLVGQANQSVNFKSMQKNINMHDLVLNHMIEYYDDIKNNIPENNKNFICRRIALVASNQLGTYLSYDDKKYRLEKIKEFNKELKEKNIDIYKEYSKTKKAAMIIKSKYLLTNIIAKMYVKKYGENRY